MERQRKGVSNFILKHRFDKHLERHTDGSFDLACHRTDLSRIAQGELS